MYSAEAKYSAPKNKWRRYIPILGGFLIHLTLGTMQCFGNLVIYTTSYMRVVGGSSSRYKDVSWIYCCAVVTQGIFGFLGGKFENKFGPRWAALLGGWLMSLGLTLSYFTVFNFWLFLLTYGIIGGIGCGLCYSIPLACALKWMPQSKAIVSGFIFVGRGLSVFVCTPIQTYFVNPENLQPSFVPYPQYSEESYYSDMSLLSRVPHLFLYMGIFFAFLQLIGAVVMSNPSEEDILEDPEAHARLLNEARTGILGKAYYTSYGSNGSSSNNSDDSSASRGGMNNINIETILSPMQILSSTYFWYLWMMMLCTWQTVAFTQAYWKLIGSNMINIQSDLCLSFIGSFASLANTFGRILWGYVGNLCGFKFSMLCMCMLITLFISTMPFSAIYGAFSYAIWICIIFMTHGGSFAVFPAITADAFGKRNFGPVFGLLFSARAASSIINSILVSVLADSIGFFGLAVLVAACTAFSCLVALLFRPMYPPVFEKNNLI